MVSILLGRPMVVFELLMESSIDSFCNNACLTDWILLYIHRKREGKWSHYVQMKSNFNIFFIFL